MASYSRALRCRPLVGENPRPGQLLAITPAGGLDALRRAAVWPHGFGVSPDGRTIYVSDYATRTVYAMQRDGSDAREFCRSPRGSVDGLAIDAEGGLWWPSVRAERLRGSSPMVSCTS